MEMKKMNFDDVRKKLNVVKTRSQREHYKPVMAAMADAMEALMQAVEEREEAQIPIINAGPPIMNPLEGFGGQCCQEENKKDANENV